MHSRLTRLAVAACMLAAAFTAHAQSADKAPPAAGKGSPMAGQPTGADAAGEALYWYDGGTRRPLRVDESRVARFDATGKSARLDEVVAPGQAGRKDPAATATVSPVLRDATGQPRALPGGVIVTLATETGPDEAVRQLQALGLQPLRPIGGPGSRHWLVASEPGLPSLQLANRLHETGQVGAEPNWWRPRATK